MTNGLDLRAATILVTGGAGFLGRRVCALLEHHGAGQIVVPRRSEHDLTVQSDVARLFAQTRPDVVLHLAAEVGGIGANRAHPGRYFYANMAMGLHVIEQSRIHGVQKLVQVGTVCSYPKHTPVPFHEDDLWSGYPEETNAPYGIAKKSLLTMLQAYNQECGFRFAYLLLVNLYGPEDNFDPETSHVIPALIRKFSEARAQGKPRVVLWGTGEATREFLHVDDAARAIVLATERYDGIEPVNVGAGKEIAIRELASLVADLVGYEGEIVWDAQKPDGQPRRRLNTDRAHTHLGFEAEVPIVDGLRETIAWWRTRAEPTP